jgi:hypothetical protein
MWANTSREKVLPAIARKLGIAKLIGWHTFRHSYSSLLAENGNRRQGGAGTDAACQSVNHYGVVCSCSNGTETSGAEPRRACAVRVRKDRTGPMRRLKVTLTYPDCVQKVRVRLRKCLGENGRHVGTRTQTSTVSIIVNLHLDPTNQIARQCSSTGAAVPSDHWATGIRNRVCRSGVSVKATTTGEPGNPAPQLAGSVSGTKNIGWGCQCPSRSLKYPCLDIM